MDPQDFEPMFNELIKPVLVELELVKNQLKMVQQLNQQLRNKVANLEKGQQHLHQSMY